MPSLPDVEACYNTIRDYYRLRAFDVDWFREQYTERITEITDRHLAAKKEGETEPLPEIRRKRQLMRWIKTFKRIPDERRNGQYKQRSYEQLCEDVSRAFDQIYLQKLVIRVLFCVSTVEFGVVKWMASHLWDCIEAGRKVAALVWPGKA